MIKDLTWLDRVKIEKLELDEKIEKLHAFLEKNEGSKSLDIEMYAVMVQQEIAMVEYSKRLKERIAIALNK